MKGIGPVEMEGSSARIERTARSDLVTPWCCCSVEIVGESDDESQLIYLKGPQKTTCRTGIPRFEVWEALLRRFGNR